VLVEQHGAEQLGVHQLRVELDGPAELGELRVQLAARRRVEGQPPLAERACSRAGDEVVAVVEEPRPGDRGGGRVQPDGYLDHLVVAWLHVTGDEPACGPAANHPSPVGRAQRARDAEAVDL
jgi:hypothetical protein